MDTCCLLWGVYEENLRDQITLKIEENDVNIFSILWITKHFCCWKWNKMLLIGNWNFSFFLYLKLLILILKLFIRNLKLKRYSGHRYWHICIQFSMLDTLHRIYANVSLSILQQYFLWNYNQKVGIQILFRLPSPGNERLKDLKYEWN